MSVFSIFRGRRDSNNDRATNSSINRKMEENRKIEQERTAALLLLGAGDSGKSTVLKQIRIIHASNITPDELDLQRETILTRTIKNARMLAQKNASLESTGVEDCFVGEEAVRTARDRLIAMRDTDTFDEGVASDIITFWSHDAARQSMRHPLPEQSQLSCDDTAPWFFERSHELCQPGYRPSQGDYIRVRAPTTGINTEQITVPVGGKPWIFRFTDVGGQRNERKKWIHVFDNVNAVIWVASLSEYDQMLFEDGRVNRMQECFDLFSDTLSLDAFAETDCIVFLNKNDVFREKIKTVPFTSFVSDFHNPHDPEAVIAWIQERFLGIFNEGTKRGASRTLSFHVTCATDEDIIKNVMDQVMVGLTHARLQRIGMMG